MQREVKMLFWQVSVARAKQTFLAVLIASFLAAGCNRETATSHRTGQGNVKTYTEAELNKLIVPGMSAAEMTNTFGSPGAITEIDQGVIMWTYSFPLQPTKTAMHLAGFSIYLKDGNVVKWSPVMAESRQMVKAGGAQDSYGEQSFQLFLATGTLTNLVSSVDSDGSADASNLKASPDLVFRAKVFAGRSGNEPPGKQTVILVLSEQDAAKLKQIAESNFGKRLLIVCRNQVVAAPVISASPASRQLMFMVKTTVLNNIQGQ